MNNLKIENCLISVSNKDGIFELAEFLNQREINIMASDGTAKHLKENGIEVQRISDYTEVPPLVGGRVKTLHPKIFAGILADRDNPEHMSDLENSGIIPIQMVMVNLYPFEKKIDEVENISELIEYIDIGGVALIRAAAKNFKYCLVITSPDQYEEFMSNYNPEMGISPEILKSFAVQAFEYTMYYDSVIANTLEKEFEVEPEEFILSPFRLDRELRYGENPHQRGRLYRNVRYTGDSIFNYKQVQGKELSYNNILDIDVAIRIINDFREPNCVVIKHNNPCGFAVGHADLLNFEKAWAGDPVSAFGSVIGFNYTVTKEIADVIFSRFIEVIICKDIDDSARDILKKKKKLRILVKKNKRLRLIKDMDHRQVKGGYLVQDEDDRMELTEELKLVTNSKFDNDYLNDVFYGLKLIKYFKSNSILFVKEGKLISAGFGQPNRVDCVKIAIEKAGEEIKDSVLVSDAFFPFRDSIDLVKDLGIAGVVEPGGSIRDKEVIEACDEYEIPMYFTGVRHFKH